MLTILANWKTTLLGAGALFTGIGALLTHLGAGDVAAATSDWSSIAAAFAGLGLIFAKDFNTK